MAEKTVDSACEKFRQKYHDYEFALYKIGNIRGDHYDFYPHERRLLIMEYDLVLMVFKYFGNDMHKLQVQDVAFPGNQSTEVNRYINEYASKSLTHFHMDYTKADTFAQFKKPFKNVTEFICSIQQRQVGDIEPFTELFPSLRRFSITAFSTSICRTSSTWK